MEVMGMKLGFASGMQPQHATVTATHLAYHRCEKEFKQKRLKGCGSSIAIQASAELRFREHPVHGHDFRIISINE